MDKYMLSSRQIMFLIAVFLFGSSVVIGVNINSTVAQDSWISLFLSLFFIIPYMLMFARIVKLFPQKNLYQIIDILFNKKIAKIIIVSFIIFAFYLGGIVLCNFDQYVDVTTLPETPLLPISVCFIVIVTYLARSGLKTIGRWGMIILVALTVVVSFTLFFSVPHLDIKYIFPIMEHPVGEITYTAYSIFMLPFAELIVLLGLADQFNITKKERRTFVIGVIIDWFLILSVLIRNILILGAPLLKNTFFSSYEAVRIIEVGTFLTRMEGVVTMNFILGGITKLAIFVISLSKGIGHLSKNNDYRKLVFPVGLVILGTSPLLFKNVVDMFDFAPIFGLYAIPFQIILPILIWLTAEYKNKKGLLNIKKINDIESLQVT